MKHESSQGAISSEHVTQYNSGMELHYVKFSTSLPAKSYFTECLNGCIIMTESFVQ